MRADQALVSRGLAASRSAAQRLIAAGAVRIADARGERPVHRAAEPVTEHSRLIVADSDETRFVSRAGAKLSHALAASGADPRGCTVLDIGQSTGGFTDCLLAHGAARVVGVEVGHGQLAERLRADPRVVCLEGFNARGLTPDALRAAAPDVTDLPASFDWVVIDVSFISLTQVLGAAATVARPGTTLIALVKPQFEVGPQGLDARGVVRDEASLPWVRERIEAAARAAGWVARGWHDSALIGGDGNREFFLHAGFAPG